MYRWILKKLKQLWVYIYSSVVSGKAFAAFIACVSWLLIVALGASFFLTPKPWYVQFSLSLLGIGGGGLLGLIIGFVIGGIGVALAGTAIGIAGWIAGAIFGATIGGFFGLVMSFISNPAAYTFHTYRFAFVLAFAFVTAYVIYKLFSWVFLQIKTKWLQ